MATTASNKKNQLLTMKLDRPTNIRVINGNLVPNRANSSANFGTTKIFITVKAINIALITISG
jgi:hypothetical protein